MLKKNCEYTLLFGCRTQMYSLCSLDLLYSFCFFSLLDQWIIERSSIRSYSLDFNSPVLRVWGGPIWLSTLIPSWLFSALCKHRVSALPLIYSEGCLDQMFESQGCGECTIISRFGKGRSKSRNCSGSFSILSSHTSPQEFLIVSPFLGTFLTQSLKGLILSNGEPATMPIQYLGRDQSGTRYLYMLCASAVKP